MTDGGSLKELNKQRERLVYIIARTTCPLEPGLGAGVPQAALGVGGWHPAPALHWPPPTSTLAWGSSGWGAGHSWEGASSAWRGGGVPEACHLADLLPGPAGTTSSGPCTDLRPHFVLREMGSQSDVSGAWYTVSIK